MERIFAFVSWFSRALLRCGGVMILLAALLIAFEIGLRRIFNASLPGTTELSGYALAVGSSWSFASALLNKAHIRIDTLYGLLGNPARAILDLLALLALGVFASIFLWHATQAVMLSIQFGSRSMTTMAVPIAIPQTLWWLGWIWFLLVIALLTLRVLVSLVRGDLVAVQAHAGTATHDAEIEEQRERLDPSHEIAGGGNG